MMVRSGYPAARPGMLVCAVLSILLGAAGTGWTQSSPASPAPPAAPALGVQEPGPQVSPPQASAEPSAPPPGEDKPGLINGMGKLFDKLPSILPLKSPSETIDDLNARAKGAARDAGDALSRLAKPSTMVAGRAVCPASPNGAPDCKQAADRLCRDKGYKEGKSLNADSAEICSAKVLIPGRQRKAGDCRTDTFVTSALCQQ